MSGDVAVSRDFGAEDSDAEIFQCTDSELGFPSADYTIDERTTHPERAKSVPCLPSELCTSSEKSQRSKRRHLSKKERLRLRKNRADSQASNQKQEDGFVIIERKIEETANPGSPPDTAGDQPPTSEPSAHTATTNQEDPQLDRPIQGLQRYVIPGAVLGSGVTMAIAFKLLSKLRSKPEDACPANFRSFSEEQLSHADFTVCAVGSTGSGKSCLLNILLDPSEPHRTDPGVQTFQTGETNEPCTHMCKIGTRAGGRGVDTAGLNEGDHADLFHMINVVETLDKVGKVNAVLLVMNYRKRIDQQWKDTVLYYRDLLGKPLFDSNLCVVMTGYDSAKPGKVKVNFDTHDTILSQTRDAIKKLLDLQAAPPVFAIDCLPDKASLKPNLERRNEIINYVKKQRPINVSKLRVSKTFALRQIDEKKAKVLEGEIEQLKVRLNAAKSVPDAVKGRLHEISNQITQKEVSRKNLEERILELDKFELVVSKEHCIAKPYSRVQSGEEKFKVEAPCVIQDVDTWCPQLFDLTITHNNSTSVQGYVKKAAYPLQHIWKHDARQGFEYRVKLWSQKRYFYADAIRELKSETTQAGSILSNLNSERMYTLEKHPDAFKPAEEISNLMREKHENIHQLQRTDMSVEEARSRLVEVPQSKL